MPPPPLLEVQDLSRQSQSGEVLLHPFSAEIQSGDRILVSGPSGVGKSLALRAMALLDAAGGEVLYRGRSVLAEEVPAFRSCVMYVHQGAALPDGPVEAALRQPFTLARYRERSYSRERVLAWLERLGRGPELLERVRRDLSGGEAQLIQLVRALQLQPEMLLLDEPTASLDPETAGRVEALLEEWTAEDPERAWVWVSHQPGEAERLATRRWIFAKGAPVRVDELPAEARR